MSRNARSEEAWARIQAHLPRIYERVLNELRERPKTCKEIEKRTGIIHETISAAINHLAKIGAIEKTGETRLTPSGRKADVWQVKGAGPVKMPVGQGSLF
jgi:Fic family protein